MSHLSVFRFFWKLFHVFPKQNEVFSGEQEKESFIYVRMGWKNLSLVITVCHHSASLVMPIGNPRVMIHSYIIEL